MKIPKTMGTQHPDNFATPSFCLSPLIEGEDEIKEAIFSYKDLKIQEQMRDFEGKETNSHVIRKLLSTDEAFFHKNELGKDYFLTFRIPNPDIEKFEAKLVLETLECIPRSYDIAHAFYQKDIAPIFEVIIPMTTKSSQIINIKEAYSTFIIKR
jgi:phosphoenolpyruvate carboxylase